MVLVILTYWSCDTQLYYTQLWQLWWPLYKLSPLWRRSWRVHPEDSPLWKPSRSLNVKTGPVVLHGLYTVSFRQERSVQRQPSEARRSWTSWDVGKQQEKLKIDMMKNGVWFDGNLCFTEPKAKGWKMLNGFCWCFHQQIVKLSFPKFVVKECQWESLLATNNILAVEVWLRLIRCAEIENGDGRLLELGWYWLEDTRKGAAAKRTSNAQISKEIYDMRRQGTAS